jgi:hypothetical protein
MNSALPGGLLLLVAVVLYFLPTAIASVRKIEGQGMVAAINVILGWTLLGWLVALIWAVGAKGNDDLGYVDPRASKVDPLAAMTRIKSVD